MDIFYNLLEYPTFKEIARVIYIIILCAMFFGGPIVGSYFFCKKMQRKYQVPNWYFWTAYIFVVPVIAAPLILFASCFIDNPKNAVNWWLFFIYQTILPLSTFSIIVPFVYILVLCCWNFMVRIIHNKLI